MFCFKEDIERKVLRQRHKKMTCSSHALRSMDCLVSVRELRALDVDVFFEKEDIHTLSNEGELLLSLIAAMAENESFQMSENAKWFISASTRPEA